jgi:ABC-type bacteriocin/lantibiotic exporter with double-glycine peptidase domain
MNFYRPVVENILNEFRGKNYNYMQYVIKNENLKKRPKEIVIKNLSYNHDDNKKVFENYTTRIKLKKLIGISGKTGSGKSTLIDLISGFLNPSNGSILINNQNIFSDSKLMNQWQNMIGYVPQTINIFDDTLENNIALGQNQNQIKQPRLNKVIKICGLEQFIASKKDKLKTILGDKGAKISGGQKQKIGIARALYFNPKILILDESTNALDEINEEKIINNLILDKELISIFLITHKKKLIKKCNEVINIKTI